MSRSTCRVNGKEQCDYDENFFEVVQTEGFEEFTANPASTDEESTGITEIHCLEEWTVKYERSTDGYASD